jgi:hypothetical protein
VPPAPPKFRLSQVMLFVATTALGLLGVRGCLAVTRLRPDLGLRNLFNGLVLVSPLVMSYSIALAAASLRAPRHELTVLCRRPGFVVGWIAALSLAFNWSVGLLVSPQILRYENLHNLFHCSIFWTATIDCGGAVLVAWMMLALVGCWEAEPSFRDRAGRACGAFWIAAFLAGRLAWRLWLW